MTTVNTEWTVSQSTRWRWRGSLDDGLWSMRPSRVQRSDKLQRHLRRTTCVARRLACISDRSAASSSVHSIYKNQHRSLHFLCFSQKIHCQSESVTCQRSVCSTPPSQNLICSLFSWVSDSIRSICFYFSFYSSFGKDLSFFHPSSPFFQTCQS